MMKVVRCGESSCEKMPWSRRARVVLPLDEGPEMPIILVVGGISYDLGVGLFVSTPYAASRMISPETEMQ